MLNMSITDIARSMVVAFMTIIDPFRRTPIFACAHCFNSSSKCVIRFFSLLTFTNYDTCLPTRHDWTCNNSKSQLLEVSRAVCQQQPHSPSVHDGYTDWDLRSAASAQHLCSYVCTCSSQKQKRKNLLNWTNFRVPPNRQFCWGLFKKCESNFVTCDYHYIPLNLEIKKGLTCHILNG